MKDGSSAARNPNDICDLLVEELEDRRERLRRLLQMVFLEAKRNSRTGAAGPIRPKCKRSAPRLLG